MSVAKGPQELCHALGCILSVCIHHHHGVAFGHLLNVYKPDGDCPLVAEIAAQTQHPYGSHNGELTLKVVAAAPLHRAIVDQENLHRSVIGRHGVAKPPDQLCGRGPVIPDRHEHCQAQRWMLSHCTSIINFIPLVSKE
jgi:hypothetical protein